MRLYSVQIDSDLIGMRRRDVVQVEASDVMTAAWRAALAHQQEVLDHGVALVSVATYQISSGKLACSVLLSGDRVRTVLVETSRRQP